METGVTTPGWQQGDEQPERGVVAGQHDGNGNDRGQRWLARHSTPKQVPARTPATYVAPDASAPENAPGSYVHG